jgi:hypothetical protein
MDESIRMELAPRLRDGMPFGYAMAAGARVAEYHRALDAVIDVMRPGKGIVGARTRPRAKRSALVHMRALQAYDGAVVGASQREIAQVLFGDAAVAGKWQSDGELRAQVRYLIARARAYVSGGYIKLLEARRQSAGGENTPTIDSP